MFDRVWIALHCTEMCVYKSYVYYFSLGLADYRRMWNNIARELLDVVGVREIAGEPLRADLKIEGRVLKMHHLINMLLLRYYSEHEDLCQVHIDSIRIRVKTLSEVAKILLRALASDRDLLKYGYICLEEKWLGEIYREKVRELYGKEVELRDLEIATVELNKVGLIMYCNIVQRDAKTLSTRVLNEYYIAPHLATLWRNLDKYL